MNAVDQPRLFFLDTNILVYSFDETAPDKQQIAQRLIHEALHTQRGVISSQIIQEFLNVALRKFTRPMTVSEARTYLRAVLLPLCHHYPSTTFYDQALLIREETGFSWYDSLVVTAAIELDSDLLFSEDLSANRKIRRLTIINPFTT
jgi:predicted nucleic acid-binding protein